MELSRRQGGKPAPLSDRYRQILRFIYGLNLLTTFRCQGRVNTIDKGKASGQFGGVPLVPLKSKKKGDSGRRFGATLRAAGKPVQRLSSRPWGPALSVRGGPLSGRWNGQENVSPSSLGAFVPAVMPPDLYLS